MNGLTNIGSGGGGKNYLLNYDGVSDTIKDVKGKDIKVSVGENIYTEFNSVFIEGTPYMTTIDKSAGVLVTDETESSAYQNPERAVKLDNGKLAIASIVSTTKLNIYLSDSVFGLPSTVIYTENTTDLKGVTLITDGIHLYVAITQGKYTVKFLKLTETGTVLTSSVVATIYNNATSVSMVRSSSGELHITFDGNSSTYTSARNVFYSKSADDGQTWDAFTHITDGGNTNYEYFYPAIKLNSSGHPVIVYTGKNANSYHKIFARAWTGSAWSGNRTSLQLSSGSITTYHQEYPVLDVLTNGCLVAVWHGKDHTDTSQNNIWFSESDATGTMWSAPVKLTAGNSKNKAYPRVFVGIDDYIHVLFSNTTDYKIGKLKRVGISWQPEENFQTVSSGYHYVSFFSNVGEVIEPLLVYRDSLSGSKLKFFGVWEGTFTPKQLVNPISEVSDKNEMKATVAGALKMFNPLTNARYQGYVTKKDEFKASWKEEVPLADIIRQDTLAFGVKGKNYYFKKGEVVPNSKLSSVTSGIPQKMMEFAGTPIWMTRDLAVTDKTYIWTDDNMIHKIDHSSSTVAVLDASYALSLAIIGTIQDIGAYDNTTWWQHVVFTTWDGDKNRVYSVDLKTGTTRLLWTSGSMGRAWNAITAFASGSSYLGIVAGLHEVTLNKSDPMFCVRLQYNNTFTVTGVNTRTASQLLTLQDATYGTSVKWRMFNDGQVVTRAQWLSSQYYAGFNYLQYESYSRSGGEQAWGTTDALSLLSNGFILTNSQTYTVWVRQGYGSSANGWFMQLTSATNMFDSQRWVTEYGNYDAVIGGRRSDVPLFTISTNLMGEIAVLTSYYSNVTAGQSMKVKQSPVNPNKYCYVKLPNYLFRDNTTAHYYNVWYALIASGKTLYYINDYGKEIL